MSTLLKLTSLVSILQRQHDCELRVFWGKSPSQRSLFRADCEYMLQEWFRKSFILWLSSSTGALRDLSGKEWSVGRAEQTLDAPEAQNGVEFGHFGKSRHYWTQVYMPSARWGQTEMWSLAQRKFISGPGKERGACALKNPVLEGFQQSLFKGKVEEGRGWLLQTSWYRNPLLL